MKTIKELKKYEKPIIEEYGDLKDLTKGAVGDQWDENGYFA